MVFKVSVLGGMANIWCLGHIIFVFCMGYLKRQMLTCETIKTKVIPREKEKIKWKV